MTQQPDDPRPVLDRVQEIAECWETMMSAVAYTAAAAIGVIISVILIIGSLKFGLL